MMGFVLVPALAVAAGFDPQPPPATADDPAPAGEELPGPPEIPEVQLGPVLPTIPERAGSAPFKYNVSVVDARRLPKDQQSIWVLDFAYLPIRIVTVDVAGKGRRQIYYMYYRVVNRTGEPRMFVPQFTLVTDTGKRYEDMVIPEAVKVIQAREKVETPLRGAVDIVGILPVSGTKEGIDDVVYGVAVWEGIDPEADAFKIYVRGLSDGYRVVTPPAAEGAAAPTPRIEYKTLQINYLRPGDSRNVNEREIRPGDPPYEWVYW
jgi:hypothetical protein